MVAARQLYLQLRPASFEGSVDIDKSVSGNSDVVSHLHRVRCSGPGGLAGGDQYGTLGTTCTSQSQSHALQGSRSSPRV